MPAVISKDLRDPNTGDLYMRGNLLGRGASGVVYEYTHLRSGQKRAIKIIHKAFIRNNIRLTRRLEEELRIVQLVRHEHIVNYITHFDDDQSWYIVLDLCKYQSLAEMLKRRERLIELEIRYFVKQIVQAFVYLHANNILHRDLKPANVLLDSRMHAKVADFGFAIKLETADEKRRTQLGTANYLDPIILKEKRRGYGKEVDVWSLGCLIYVLAVGKAPFQGEDLPSTYENAKLAHYDKEAIPSKPLREFIGGMIERDLKRRLTMQQILDHPYLASNDVPNSLPISCLTMPPRTIPQPDNEKSLDQLISLLESLIQRGPHQEGMEIDSFEDPALSPILWIIMWLDCTEMIQSGIRHNRGFAYRLSDGSTGARFSDGSTMIALSSQQMIQYLDADGNESFLPPDHESNDQIRTRLKRMEYFKTQWTNHIGHEFNQDNSQDLTRLPHLLQFLHMEGIRCFQMSHGLIQVNFTTEHVKLVFCPRMEAVSFIKERRMKTYPLSKFIDHGCPSEMYEKIMQALKIIKRLRH